MKLNKIFIQFIAHQKNLHKMRIMLYCVCMGMEELEQAILNYSNIYINKIKSIVWVAFKIYKI